jgi:hypothetical protein
MFAKKMRDEKVFQQQQQQQRQRKNIEKLILEKVEIKTLKTNQRECERDIFKIERKRVRNVGVN